MYQHLKIKWENGYELKVIELADMEKIRIARNSQIDVLRQSKEISKEEQIAYFKTTVAPNLKNEKPEMILFSLFKNSSWIGYGGFTHINWEDKRAEVSFLVETKRSQDLKTYTEDFSTFLKLLCEIGFHQLHFHRLFGETFDFRKEHIKILENAGFKLEGVLREHIFIKGKPHNSLMHGLLASEYIPK